jgi:hypothetical protein
MTSATQVKERPIILLPSEVQALRRDGRARLVREMKPQPPETATGLQIAGDQLVGARHFGGPLDGLATCPFGAPGDRLWGREIFRAIEDPGAPDSKVRRKYRDDDGETHYIVVDYKADAPNRIMDKLGIPEWKSPVCMPRWASRFPRLDLAAVTVERIEGTWRWVLDVGRVD